MSTYFNPLAKESLAEVIHRWGDPFPMPTVYSHMRRHMSKKTQEIDIVAPEGAVSVVDLEEPVVSSTAHERGLDEIISKGRDMVARGEIKVTAQALLQAIKTKAEIDIKTKDRRLDAYKAMAGAFGGQKDTSEPRKTAISDTEG
jgi:hypothetical protein